MSSVSRKNCRDASTSSAKHGTTWWRPEGAGVEGPPGEDSGRTRARLPSEWAWTEIASRCHASGGNTERVNESVDSGVSAFQAFRLSSVTTRLRAWLFPAGASRLVSLATRLKYKATNDFQTSLEEAAVNRPGRKAG